MEAVDFSRRGLPEEARKRIEAKLVRGRESTIQLQFLLRSATATEHDWQALAAEIFSSFTEAISVLNSSESAADELSCPDHSLCSDIDSGDSRRSIAVKNLGRANKRRRLANTRIVTSTTTEDEHGWRKYGQKVILNTTHPRSYYRCTHKYDQGCGATKQVQKMEGDSQMYKITYISDHTCHSNSPIAAAVDAVAASDSYNICFSDSRNDQLSESTGRFFWPSDDDAAKGGETTSGVTNEMELWSDLNDFESLQETTVTTMTNEYRFSIGDDADSSHMFWDGLLQ